MTHKNPSFPAFVKEFKTDTRKYGAISFFFYVVALPFVAACSLWDGGDERASHQYAALLRVG